MNDTAVPIPAQQLFRGVIDTTDGKHFCGPRSITEITGVPISRVEKMIQRHLKNKRPVVGVSYWTTIKILERLGCKVEKMTKHESTLGRFRDDTEHTKLTYLVAVTGHYTVVRSGQKRDNTSDRKIVQAAWIVKAPDKPKYTTGATVRKRKPKPPIQEIRAKRVDASIKRWQSKLKRAQTALAKLKRQQSYYARKITT